MTTLTDRYVHAVTASLPPDQREDIAAELRAVIGDAVAARSAAGTQADGESAVLLELGPPSQLADSYRGHGRSLIGPTVYPYWLRTLRVLLGVVPTVTALVVLFSEWQTVASLPELLWSAAGAALFAALQVAFWVTVGFVIAERTESPQALTEAFGPGRAWRPEDLPEPREREVGWVDAITSIVGNAFVLVFLLALEPVAGSLLGEGAMELRWLIAVGVALSLLASIVVLVRGRWSLWSAAANTLGNVVFLAPVIWLAAQRELVNPTLVEAISGDAGDNWIWPTVGVIALVVLWDTVEALRGARRR